MQHLRGYADGKHYHTNACIPCNLRSSFSLFSHLIKVSVTCTFIEHLGLWWVKAMKSPLCMCPFKFAFFPSEVLFPCKSNLKNKDSTLEIMQQMLNYSIQVYKYSTYPLFNNKIPSPSTQGISNNELDEIKWNIKDEVIKPHHTSPTPSNPFNCSKTPICINCNQCCYLLIKEDGQVTSNITVFTRHICLN